MSDNIVYLAVLKASYDYDPQSDDELPIKENQLLLLLDKVDDDWWKVKIKPDTAEDEGPSGLVPAAYVEPADHVSVVKVLYDYEATSPGELSVQEDEMLSVYEADQDWLLVQSRKEGGKAGYVPENYVETTSEEEEEGRESVRPASVDVPPARPVSTYIDPADRVASSKAVQANSDTIKTWPITSIDKKGKKKKGTLGVGNGAIFFASESDKTPVQKWQTSDVSDAAIEKGKQLRLDIGGNNPITLLYNAGSKENAEAILEKVQSSRSLSNSRPSYDAPPAPTATATNRKVGKKVSVHFSQSDPVIIPPREEEEEEEEEEDQEGPADGKEDGEENGEPREHAVALYDFAADGDDELSIKEGEKLTILEKDGDEWWKCSNSRGEEGVVPASYLQVQATPQPASSPPLPSRTNETAEREKVAVAAREAEERAEADRRRREEERIQAEKARKKQQAQKAKEAAAEAEKKRLKPEAVRPSSPATGQAITRKSNGDGSAARQSTDLKFPPQDQVRTWHDRSGQFRVEAAFLGLSNNNKIRLHKVNGVIVEVPTEKMSVEDIRYVEKLTRKPPKSSQKQSDDDVPLAISRAQSSQQTATLKKSNWDWFEFFLSAGCDIDDCTRYATSFERDKIDEAILPDITESTMRTLGLREGDIIRVNKAIEKRKADGRNSRQNNGQTQDQIRRDEELARQLQAQETGGGSPRSSAPNLFAGPGGVLKAPRKRPQASKSLPPNVDIKALSSASDQATSSPQPSNSSSSNPVQPPARTSSAVPVVSGFDDDAWTNRPNSTKPHSSTPPVATSRTPSAPPMSASLTTGGTTQPAAPMPSPQSSDIAPPANPALPTAQSATTASSSLANTTDADIFDQLARLSELRNPGAPSSAPPTSSSPAITYLPSASYQAGLGVGPSPVPIGQHLQNQQFPSQRQPVLAPSPSPQPQPQPQSYNGPRGPYAPVPANQGLLQPLVPTQTHFSGFVPTRPITNAVGTVPLLQPPAPQSFLSAQPTGLPNQMILPQPTGIPFGGFTSTTMASSTFQSSGGFGGATAPLQSQYTGFNPNVGQFPSNSFAAAPPVPPLPASLASSVKDTSPASVFAQMKSGTFATEDGTQPQSAEKYDALRPAPLLTQPTGWSAQYQNGFIGYPS